MPARRTYAALAAAPLLVGALVVLGPPAGAAPAPTVPLVTQADPASFGADFDGDGFGDLAVGVRSEDLGALENAGVVQVLYGSAAGLESTGNQLWSQDSAGVAGDAAAFEYFGDALGWGDFDGDGFDDLAIGVPHDTADTSGVVHVLYGSAAGLTAAGSQVWSQGSSGVLDDPEPNDSFGSALLARDFNGDGAADLVIGAPGEDVGAGAVHVLFGSAAGLSSAGAQEWLQLRDKREDADAFGSTLAAGDLDGDGSLDLAIGAPYEDLGRVDDAGAVSVLYGTPTGLTKAGNQLWTQPDTGLPAGRLKGTTFGIALAIGQFNNDDEADLAAGLPNTKVDRKAAAGAVDVLYGTPSGLSAAGAQLWDQSSIGVPDAPEPLDFFGTSLVAGDFDDDGLADLAIGVPRECLAPCVTQAGAINVLYGSPTGLSGAGSELWSQDSAGVEDTGEAGDRFGQTLARGDFDGNGATDVAVGVWLEGVGVVSGAGAVHVLYAGSGGLVADGNQLWTQDSPGILDAVEDQDEFSFDLMSS